MKQDELAATLAELHAELSRIEQIDPATLEMLRALTADITRLSGRKESLAGAEAEPVTSGLRRLLLKFEAEHPELSVAVGKVADALAAMGI
jgi:Domain of unknown function (DUF4404)